MTDRNTIIRECIAALPPIPSWDTCDQRFTWVNRLDTVRALEALLSAPEQAECATLSKMETVDNWTPDERTVNAVCDWFQEQYPHSIGADNARKVFLPPDPIAALVERFIGSVADDPHINTDARMVRLMRWLVSEGRLTL